MRVYFVCVLGDETPQVGSADCKLSAVSGALQRPDHASRTEPEGERPCSIPPDCPKCSRKVGDAVHGHTHICAYSKVDKGSGRQTLLGNGCQKQYFISISKELCIRTDMHHRKRNVETERECKHMMNTFKDSGQTHPTVSTCLPSKAFCIDSSCHTGVALWKYSSGCQGVGVETLKDETDVSDLIVNNHIGLYQLLLKPIE